MLQVLGFLLAAWEIRLKFLAPGFSLPSPSRGGHLAVQEQAEDSSLSNSTL